MSDIFKNVTFLLACFLMLVFGRSTLLETFRIPSESMVPTLLVDDYILVNKLAYGLHLPFNRKSVAAWGTPARGTVVVFFREDAPETEGDESLQFMVKRVIALAGETVEIRENKVLINNELLEEPYAQWDRGGAMEGNFGPQTVPAGHIFVLGDNRDHSTDSRFWNSQPFVPLENVSGNVLMIFYSRKDIWRSAKWVQ